MLCYLTLVSIPASSPVGKIQHKALFGDDIENCICQRTPILSGPLPSYFAGCFVACVGSKGRRFYELLRLSLYSSEVGSLERNMEGLRVTGALQYTSSGSSR